MASEQHTASELPTLSVFTQWLSSSLLRYEKILKSLVPHHGEKGRAVESVVKSALESLLPARYRIGTGFVINNAGEQSRQVDLVIYDAISNAPILFEGGVGLFPVEIVYGTVEVKSVLDSDEIERSTSSIGSIRNLAKHKLYADYITVVDENGNAGVGERPVSAPLPPRAYIFAVTSSLSTAAIPERLAAATERNGAHVHGLALLEPAFYCEQQIHRPRHEFNVHTDNAFERFYTQLLAGIQSIEMKPVFLKAYLNLASPHG